MSKLVSFFGQDDTDILPLFLDYYRNCGISEFHIFVHGAWSDREFRLLRSTDIVIAGTVPHPYSDAVRSSTIEGYCRRFAGEWLVIVDADEFLELPFASLKRTIQALCCLGIEELPAVMLQRASADGSLPTLSSGSTLDKLFPSYDYRLAERMHVATPVWKIKYPLTRVGPDFSYLRGGHLPHSGRPTAHVPVRGVIHHFKWRDRLLASLARTRGDGSSQDQQDAYLRWLDEHGQRLPIEGLRPCGRQELFEAGYLLRPTRGELGRLVAQRKCIQAPRLSAGDRNRVATLIDRVPSAAPQADAQAAAYLCRQQLLNIPGRIALVTTELAGLHRTGGIGTAMAALAERLAAAGHDVHVLFCPYVGQTHADSYWLDYWKARGVTVHHFPRWTRTGESPQSDEFSLSLCERLAADDWDVIHFHDNGGYAAGALALRAAGLAFQDTRIAVTLHGPTRWARQGNYLPWIRSEALQAHLEAISVDLADVVICPSRYILEWSRSHFGDRAPHIVIPNALTGESRRFGRVVASRRRVEKIVYFGRIEPRKGIDIFLDAIEGVLAASLADFEVVFLGKLEPPLSKEELAERAKGWTCKVRLLTGYTSHEAIDLLRNENCIVVIPSQIDNSPYTVYECLENGIPFIASDIGGIPELVREEDRPRVLLSGGAGEYAAKLIDALQNGAYPASLRFDPQLADFDLLATHARLIDDARSSRGRTELPRPSEVTAIIHGASSLGALQEGVLQNWAGGGAEVLSAGPSSSATAGATRSPSSAPVVEGRDAAQLNRLAHRASGQYLLFWHASVSPRLEALSAMVSALERTGADAIVCGYSVPGDGEPTSVLVSAGPPELSAGENVFGARLFLVRKASFLELGGFVEQGAIAPIIEWELLNRMTASGRRVFGIPLPLSTVHALPVSEPTPYQRGSLALPWVAEAPVRLQGFVRMALHPDAQASPTEATRREPATGEVVTREMGLRDLLAQRSRASGAGGKKPNGPHTGANEAAASGSTRLSVNGETLDASLPSGKLAHQEGEAVMRQRMSAGGLLLDLPGTYMIRSAGDAEACDFLVADALLSSGQCHWLSEMFGELEESIVLNGGGPVHCKRFLRLSEILAARPESGPAISDALQRAVEATREFYGLEDAIYPDQVRFMKVPEGNFIGPRTEPFSGGDGGGNGASDQEFAGLLCLNDDFEGGEVYFPELDIAVAPRRGSFIATPAGASYRRAMLRVRSGVQLIMPFTMTATPRFKNGTLRQLFKPEPTR